jgi:hypothetical protein
MIVQAYEMLSQQTHFFQAPSERSYYHREPRRPFDAWRGPGHA